MIVGRPWLKPPPPPDQTGRASTMLKGSDFVPVPARGEGPNVTRFAPSPTGYLHLGHAYSAQFAYEAARLSGGRFLLRIEDIDPTRCRAEFERGIVEDLRWLGLRWDGAVRRQSQHIAAYGNALRRLKALGVVYPCFCTRSRIRAEIEGAGHAPHGPSGEAAYPGLCRHLPEAERRSRIDAGEPYAQRLDVAKALEATGPLAWRDERGGTIPADPGSLGDVVLARKDVPTSYHLAVTVDDHLQGVTLVTRGEDLFHATHVHRLLQALLGLRTPRYYHHNLVADSTGQRLAKRNRAVTIRHLRERHWTPDRIWRAIESGALPTALAEAG
jgi:glutamyl-Q tRNA(Asp) synthetase